LLNRKTKIKKSEVIKNRIRTSTLSFLRIHAEKKGIYTIYNVEHTHFVKVKKVVKIHSFAFFEKVLHVTLQLN